MRSSALCVVLPLVAALAPQTTQTQTTKTVDRRTLGTGLISSFGAFAATAPALAGAGESPKFSFFGILGNSDTYSEGAAYGMDQKDKVYSPYSVYGPLGAPDA